MNPVGALRPQVRGGGSSGSSERRPYRIPISIPSPSDNINGAETILLLLLLQSKTGSAAQGVGGAGLRQEGLEIPTIEIPPPPQEFSLSLKEPVEEPTKFLMQDGPPEVPEKRHPPDGIG